MATRMLVDGLFKALHPMGVCSNPFYRCSVLSEGAYNEGATFECTLRMVHYYCIEVDPGVYVVQLTDEHSYINAIVADSTWKTVGVAMNSWVLNFLSQAVAGTAWDFEMTVKR